jgi:hypothetical protein
MCDRRFVRLRLSLVGILIVEEEEEREVLDQHVHTDLQCPPRYFLLSRQFSDRKDKRIGESRKRASAA